MGEIVGQILALEASKINNRRAKTYCMLTMFGIG